MQESGLVGETKAYAPFGATSTVHTNQPSGSIQYIQSDGTISNSVTENKIGRATSATDIHVTKNP